MIKTYTYSTSSTLTEEQMLLIASKNGWIKDTNLTVEEQNASADAWVKGLVADAISVIASEPLQSAATTEIDQQIAVLQAQKEAIQAGVESTIKSALPVTSVIDEIPDPV